MRIKSARPQKIFHIVLENEQSGNAFPLLPFAHVSRVIFTGLVERFRFPKSADFAHFLRCTQVFIEILRKIWTRLAHKYWTQKTHFHGVKISSEEKLPEPLAKSPCRLSEPTSDSPTACTHVTSTLKLTRNPLCSTENEHMTSSDTFHEISKKRFQAKSMGRSHDRRTNKNPLTLST